MTHRLRWYENIHILMWLLKDICWMMEFKTAGVIIFIPTILLAVWLTIITYSSELFLPNASVACWIAANGTWMLGEFFAFDFKPLATMLFLTGTVIIAAYFITRRKHPISRKR